MKHDNGMKYYIFSPCREVYQRRNFSKRGKKKLAFSISLKIISRGVQPNCGLDSPTQTIWAELMSAGLCPLENDTVELVFMKTQSLPISKSHCSLINGKNS